MQSELVERQLSWLAPIRIKCSRVILQLSQPRNPDDWNLTTVRGVWGKALRFLDEKINQRVFIGVGGKGHRQTLYSFRPDTDAMGNAYSDLDNALQIPLQWTTFNVPESDDAILEMAWHRAGRDGIGSHRSPFDVKIERIPINPAENSDSLGKVVWVYPHSDTPVQCVFPFSVSLTQNGRANPRPTLTDIVSSALNRLGALRHIAVSEDLDSLSFPPQNNGTWPEFAAELIEQARITPQNAWQGVRQNLSRYSGRQKTMVMVQGVAGCIGFPRGVGDLWPLLAAASWTQIGKGTTQGMGRPCFLRMN